MQRQGLLSFNWKFPSFFIGILFLAACQGGADSVVRTPNNYAVARQTDSTDGEEVPVPLNSKGRMNGVAYLISRDLSNKGDQDTLDFPELHSAFESDNYQWRPQKGFDIPLTNNDKVEKWVRIFTGTLRPKFSIWMQRASLYAPFIESILKEYNLPRDLLYLAMIESGFNLNAYSHAHAAGPWQFIRSTGRMYGLKSEGYIDERRDIEKATRAAAAHLRDLHQLYGDWYLAFAAYNAGPGSVNRAIRRSGTRDYWRMTAGKTRFLRQETKDYVPRILAAATVVKNYKKYGFSSDLFGAPLQFETTTVPDSTDFRVIAQCAETSMDEIKLLNPSLVMGVTPPGQAYTINLPPGTAQSFRRNYSSIPASQRVRFAYHKVKRKETMATIAKRYGISRADLARANKLSTTSKLVAGRTLMIPIISQPQVVSAVAQASFEPQIQPTLFQESPVSETASAPQTHRVKRGETLGKIAQRYGLSVASLRKLNSLGSKNMIRAGQVLKVFPETEVIAKETVNPPLDTLSVASSSLPAEQEFYTVKSGDTLWKIAGSLEISVADLIQSNPALGSGTRIKARQKILIPQSVNVVSKSSSVVEAAPASRMIVHAVRRGETLWEVSKKYRVTVKQLKEWNRLATNQLFPNQKLVIYASYVPSGKKVATAR